MADLSRQLQEYLAQSKGGGAAAGGTGGSGGLGVPSAPQSPGRAGPAPPAASGSGWGSWFGRANLFPTSSPSSQPPPQLPEAVAPPGPGSRWGLPGGLSRGQRLVGSALCLSLAAFCFGLAALYGSLLRLRKFALLWSLGSAFALGAAGFLRGGGGGPGRLLGDPEGRGLALLYLGSVGATLYAALALRSGLLATLGAVVQVAAGAAYLLASVPGGATGLRYVGRLLGGLVRRQVSKTLPV